MYPNMLYFDMHISTVTEVHIDASILYYVAIYQCIDEY